MSMYGPYTARVVDVHDGDTVVLDIDLGFDHLISGKDWYGKTRLSCRIVGINSPELDTNAGKVARDYAKTLLPAGAIVRVTSWGWDKYGGRFDGEVMMPDGRDFGTVMVASGNAVTMKT
jgi:endonuclease YncB( thermonuclease family)